MFLSDCLRRRERTLLWFDYGKLKKLRRQLGLKQNEAVMLFNQVSGSDVSAATLGNWENGRTNITVKDLMLLTRVYGVSDISRFFYEKAGD